MIVFAPLVPFALSEPLVARKVNGPPAVAAAVKSPAALTVPLAAGIDHVNAGGVARGWPN